MVGLFDIPMIDLKERYIAALINIKQKVSLVNHPTLPKKK